MTMKAWSGYDAANWSTSRGYVYFPALNTKRDLSDYTLNELRKKSHWLYNNVGLATRIIDGIANMVGALTPIPLTDDKEWNELALKNFTNNAGAEFVFDVSGKFNFWSPQKMMTRSRLLNGDILAVLTETASKIARVMFYEAHQVGNADNDYPLKDQDQWNAGVRTGPQNQGLAYRILTEEGQKSVDIPAADAILLADLRWPCRQRGEPIMRHAVNNLLDRTEILGFMKASIKNASMIGYQIVRDPTAGTYPNRLPALGAGPTEIDLNDGNATKVMVEEAYKPGKVPVMNPGEEIKLLLDQRPHPNQIDGLDYLVRDICAGTPFSADLLWNIAKLGGATARYVIADAQKAVESEQNLNADLFCERFWAYYIAKELKMGRLRPCQDPEWWKVGWQPEQKLTVDIGRDGALYLQMHKAGMISLKRWFGSSLGANWKPEMNDYLEERAYVVNRVKELGLTMQEAFPPEPGAAPQNDSQDVSAKNQTPVVAGVSPAQSVEDGFFKKMFALMATKKTEAPVNVHMPPVNMPKPEINVKVDMPPFPEPKEPVVHFNPVIRVDPAKIPETIVNVAAPNVTVTPPDVHVAAPQVTVTMPKSRSVKFKRDAEGKITGAESTS